MSVRQGFSRCIRLTAEAIDQAVGVTSPGVYALGSAQDSNILHILYVGRADEDVNRQLKSHVGAYAHFQFVCVPSARLAFDRECWLYHTFRPIRQLRYLDDAMGKVKVAF